MLRHFFWHLWWLQFKKFCQRTHGSSHANNSKFGTFASYTELKRCKRLKLLTTKIMKHNISIILIDCGHIAFASANTQNQVFISITDAKPILFFSCKHSYQPYHSKSSTSLTVTVSNAQRYIFINAHVQSSEAIPAQ